ncbi:hypothetical protein QZH41_016236 [Actinostola sp. cb2023]|nr:hypothetical protein QZH41_016236 [Actinostola sp. cb2023]
MEHGHVLSACQFRKSMNEIQVEATILEAYEGKIPPGVDIEILLSVHNKLLKPTLAPGQDGINDDEEELREEEDKDRESDDMDDSGNNNVQANQPIPSVQIPAQTNQPIPSVQIPTQTNQPIPSVQIPAQTNQPIPSVQIPAQTNQPIPSSQIPVQPNQNVFPLDSAVQAELIPDEDDVSFRKSVVICRSNIRKNIIEIFAEPDILSYHTLDVVVLDQRGQPEKGKGKGVLLDILTEFWQEFFMALAVGTNERIPYIRHDLQKPQWESIGRVLVYGYNYEGKLLPTEFVKTLHSFMLIW